MWSAGGQPNNSPFSRVTSSNYQYPLFSTNPSSGVNAKFDFDASRVVRTGNTTRMKSKGVKYIIKVI